MRIRTTIKALAVCVLLVGLTAPGSSYADARRPPRDAGSQSDRFIEEQAEQLGLDEQTMAAIRTIVDASRARGQSLRTELHTAYAQMRELHSRRRPDFMQACQADSTNLCQDATHWRTRMQCLHDHIEELSETCRAAIQTR